jgi:NDP-sugar pyrophosphorylase family protein
MTTFEPNFVADSETETSSLGAIVLAGTYHGSSVFGSIRPRPLLPVAQKPLVEYVLGWLHDSGVPSATLCANGSTDRLRAHLADGHRIGIALGYHEDESPRGAAGCVKDAAGQSSAQTLVVADGTSIPVADLRRIVAHHRRTGAKVTIAVQRHVSPGSGPVLQPSGIYLFERDVLDMVPSTSFQDIKESLIPKLYKAGVRVEVFELDESSPRVLNAETYLAANQWMIARMASALRAKVGTSDALVHPSAWVDGSATLLGPVLLGPGVRVHEGALIVGPTSIGAGTTVGAGAVVARSVLWEHCIVGERAIVDQSVMADCTEVGAGVALSSAMRGTPARPGSRVRQPVARHNPKLGSGHQDALAKPALS